MPGVGKRDVLQADAPGQPRRHRQVGVGDEGRRVVFEPGQADRAVHPDTAQEADLADGRADIRRQARASGQHEQHGAGRCAEPRRHEDDRADVGAAEHRPGERVPDRRAPPGRGTGPYQRSQASRRSVIRRSAMPVTRTSLPGGAVVARVKRWRARRFDWAPRSWATRSTAGPPRGREHGRQREDGQQHQRGMDRGQQRDGDAEPQDPAAGGKQRHVHVVQHEDLVAQDGEPIEVVGAFLVGDGRHRRLQARDVGLEGNGHPVAEAALHAGADGAQEPRRGRGHAEGDRRHAQQQDVVLEDAVAEELEPQGQQRVGQRRQHRQPERPEHEARLMAKPELAQPPHRRQRRRHFSRLAVEHPPPGPAHQARTSYTTPSSSSLALKRWAWSSNIVQ